MKTSEKPSTKASDVTMHVSPRRRPAADPPRISSSETPETNET